MPKSRAPIEDQLRAVIAAAEKRGVTRYRIAQDSGVSESMLSRIVHDQTTPTLATAQRILKAIGMRLDIRRDT